jgi:putative hydrolase of the HAD superfamily
MKKMIKAVLFDYGGVISMSQNPRTVDEMCGLARMPSEPFMINYKKYRNDYDLNKLSATEYWQKVLNGGNTQFSHETIQNLIRLDVESWTVINKDMLQFIINLKSKTVKKVIISNMTIETLEYMKKNFSWLELFDHLVFSCELKSSKPAGIIFHRCLELLDLEPQSCVFIDDSLENIWSAQRFGLNTIHFRNYRQFSKEMNRTYKLI